MTTQDESVLVPSWQQPRAYNWISGGSVELSVCAPFLGCWLSFFLGSLAQVRGTSSPDLYTIHRGSFTEQSGPGSQGSRRQSAEVVCKEGEVPRCFESCWTQSLS